MKVETFADCEKAALKIVGFYEHGVAEEIAEINGIEHPLLTELKLAETNANRWSIAKAAGSRFLFEIRNEALLEVVRYAAAGAAEGWKAFECCGANTSLADEMLMAMLGKTNVEAEIHKIRDAARKYGGTKSQREALRQLCEMA